VRPRARAHDNIFVERLRRSVKYEEVYLYEYACLRDVRLGRSATSTPTITSASIRPFATERLLRCITKEVSHAA
jgi:hypothetical protein